jgi:hypothetical protein
MDMSPEVLKSVMTPDFAAAMGREIGKAMAAVMKASTASGSTHNLVHGPGSMFGQGQVGIEPEVISTMMHWRGVADMLPTVGVRTRELLLPFITGVEPTSSTEPSTECANCISGETEACLQHFPLGKVCRQTQTMTPERIIERLNRGDIDLTLLNDQLGSDSPWHPGDSFASMGQQGLMQVAAAWALMFELPPLFMAALSPMVYSGNPVNNRGDGYREFRGLQLLVNTGFRDALSNVTCPGLDSDVKNANYKDVANTAATTVYQLVEMAHYYVRNNAEGQRLAPVRFAAVMRPEMWQVLSGYVPQQAILNTIANMTIPNGVTVNLDGQTIVNERNAMRQGLYIPLNGEMVQVILDHGIPELNNANDAHLAAGQYASDIYILPLTYLGNRPALRVEYKDYRFISEEVRATDDLIGGLYSWSPDGRFSWTWVKDGPCFLIRANIEPRIILRTPQLAARIQNIKYVPVQHLREPDPDSSYFFKGGVSTRSPATYYY